LVHLPGQMNQERSFILYKSITALRHVAVPATRDKHVVACTSSKSCAQTILGTNHLVQLPYGSTMQYMVWLIFHCHNSEALDILWCHKACTARFVTQWYSSINSLALFDFCVDLSKYCETWSRVQEKWVISFLLF
jgi:hypothetical protein